MDTTITILALQNSVKSLEKRDNAITLQEVTALAKQLTFQVKYHWDALKEDERNDLKNMISATLETDLGLSGKLQLYTKAVFFAARFWREFPVLGDCFVAIRDLQEAVLEKIEQESEAYQQMLQERLRDSAVVQGETRGAMNGSQAKRRLRELI